MATRQTNLAQAVKQIADTLVRLDAKKPTDRRVQTGAGLIMVGNAAVAALLFGQAFSGFPFNLRYASLGVLTMVLTYTWANTIMMGGDR